ncbi:BspA family leucine-rich repeat surface protein [Companilactobacillus keshanensis]|uniref:BspA family leucine-rich repeat surface protein n=1 Tax=Companilactobacillus keshanensis TaxID=2486003 RepID=A0ABW4BSV9_9LACO|nr:SLAP domain-containing protein [Companilactobacillus keshanensis]
MIKAFYKTGRNLLLLSALITGGIFAIDHPTISSADTVKDDNLGDPVLTSQDGESTTWALYPINGDDSNLALHITSGVLPTDFWDTSWTDYKDYTGANYISKVVFDGNVTAGTSLSNLFDNYPKLTSVEGLNKLDTSNTSSFSNMFSNDPSLKSLDLSSLDTSSATSFSSMLSGDTSLKSIKLFDLVKFPTSPATDFSNMFLNDSSLNSLDLSNVNMTFAIQRTLANMLKGTTGLESLTLSKNNILTNTGLENEISTGATLSGSGWKKDGENDSTAITSTKLTDTIYGAGVTRPDTTTWVPANIKKLTSFYLQYTDSNGNVLGIVTDSSGTKTNAENETIDLSDSKFFGKNVAPAANNLYFSGYKSGFDSTLNYSFDVPAYTSDPVAAPIKLNKIDPTNINVNITGEDGTKVDHSFTIPVNDPDYTYANIKVPSSELDLNNSKITIGSSDETSLSDYIKTNNLSVTDLNGILSSAIDKSMTAKNVYTNGTTKTVKMYSDDDSNTTPISINAVYKKTDSGNSGNNNNGSDTGIITDNNQVVATGSQNVPLYNSQGKLLTDYALAKNSDWRSDKQLILNGITYYRVSTDAWVKSDDVYLFESGNTNVSVHHDKYAKLVNSKKAESNRGLRASSDWKSDRSTTLSGIKYYRVSTNEFVNSNSVYPYKPVSDVFSATDSTAIYDDYGNNTGKTLSPGSYKVDRIGTINGESYYRVSTNQFVKIN